ncbi:hypothetical protein [Rhizobium lentis]|uniref:Uncharacterized protein n=1 Tax=Rhizobium lentis TaxID=1138194 RepID=A0A7W8UPL4_9HYPH|nr:hypothetical protein [Rhizobium lentis]MBB4574435.1 hypothetical protein [Rhizobium lentis]MBB5550361.1 hypothetical protein [Rhizobium lentis]MBB5560610.1 hypothetical protein [Rhizobium lentis]MBB5567195.1 hypothetical protein [Rhizobium lentis]
MTLTNQDRANIRRIFAKIRGDTDRLTAEKVRATGASTHPDIAKIIAAQNTLRKCIEVVFEECLPYDEVFCGEMAVRLAAYAISAVPIERHQDTLEAVVEGLPSALARRVRDGVIIRTEWETGGVRHPNVPRKGDVQ